MGRGADVSSLGAIACHLPTQMWGFSEPGSPRTPHSCPGKVTAKGNPGGKPAEASLAPSLQRTFPLWEKWAFPGTGTQSEYLESRQVRAGACGLPVPVAWGALLRGSVSQLHPGPRVPQEPREAGPLRRREVLVWGGVGSGLGVEAGGPGLHAQGLFLKQKLILQASHSTSFPISRAFQPAWVLLLWVGHRLIIPSSEVATPTPIGQRKTRLLREGK